ncbi:MAG: hypothetical protein Aureis2KO_02460 [Aureisphaera sp.]
MGAYAQTDGLTYQAIILDPNIQELPGVNASGNILPNAQVTLRFTIFSQDGSVAYKEQHQTQTDADGMINLVIGQGEQISQNAFTNIRWVGTRKDLMVEINLGDRFNELSTQTLTFVPFAFHRDIIATGNLNAEGDILFGENLVVNGTANLNSSLNVNNESATQLSGSLSVTGATQLNNSLDVNNQQRTRFTGTLEVDGDTHFGDRLGVADATQLNSTLQVEGSTRLRSTLDVEGTTRLRDRLIVDEAVLLNSTLTVEDATILRRTLDVDGATTLNNALRVDNQRATTLSGDLTVDGVSDFNSNVLVNNASNVNVSGDMTIGGDTVLQQDVTVEGDTNLNSSLSVNNGNPTSLSGILAVEGQTSMGSELLTQGTSDLNNLLRVNNGSDTYLSGTLSVGLATQLNGRLMVLNGSPTYLSGSLNVNGEIEFGDNLTVEGITNFNDELNVLNGALVTLSGDLDVEGNTALGGNLDVFNATTLNDNLTVTNSEPTSFTGPLEIDGATTLNNALEVTGQSPSSLNGTLSVDEATVLNASLDVLNGSPSALTGTLTVDESTSLQANLDVTNGSSTFLSGNVAVEEATDLNALNVNNSAETELTGILTVAEATTLNDILTVNNATTLNNDLTVTGSTSLTNLTSSGISVSSDNPNAVATFVNTNTQNGKGITIKLGKNHGAWDGSTIVQVPNPTLADLDDPQGTYYTEFQFLKAKLQNPGPITFNEAISLAPDVIDQMARNNIQNQTFTLINNNLGLPKAFPDLNMPGRLLSNEIQFYGGNDPQCSGQYCYSVCFPFAGCIRVCIPPINICIPRIPRIAFPGITVPTIPLSRNLPSGPPIPNPANYFPALGINFPTGNVPQFNIPNIPNLFNDPLTKENEYMKFVDKDDRMTGVIRAQSTSDFIDNTALDNLYVLNVLSNFIGVDIVEGEVAGTVALVNYIDEFNKLGVEYSSGNGDYAEWLERIDHKERITFGDIVAVKGGKITKDLQDAEQVMVASHHPIIQGNAAEAGQEHLGNNVAFVGQVPVKVMGPVRSGDYIVASFDISGYGVAKSEDEMKLDDYTFAVGRSWENNLSEGPKLINVVVGVKNGDFSTAMKELEKDQKQLEAKVEGLEARLLRITQKLKTVEQKEETYASH